MKLILATLLCSTLSFASFENIYSFKADFLQSITDDKNATLSYSGTLKAKKPQEAVWNYTRPIKKDVYINRFQVTVVELEIEQVIVRNIESSFDFFQIIQNAKKISKDKYEGFYKETKFFIAIENNLINSIFYKDSFENNVEIIFTNQKQNVKIDEEVFIAKYPLEFDVIRD